MYRKEMIGSGLMMLIFGSFLFMAQDVHDLCKTYPMIVTGLGFLLSAVNLGRAFYKQKHGLPVDTPSAMNRDQFIAVAITIAVSFLYIVLARSVGYITVTFLFVTAFSMYLSRRSGKWSKKWVYPLVSIAITMLLYFSFGGFLHVPLPKGILI